MATLDELRATAHPIRLRLLSLLTGAAMSTAEAGRELGLSQASASYHLHGGASFVTSGMPRRCCTPPPGRPAAPARSPSR